MKIIYRYLFKEILLITGATVGVLTILLMLFKTDLNSLLFLRIFLVVVISYLLLFYLSFDELVKEHLLNAEPKKADTGYDFLLLPSPDAESYTVTATPAAAGARYFFADQTGVLRVEKDKPATAASSEL